MQHFSRFYPCDDDSLAYFLFGTGGRDSYCASSMCPNAQCHSWIHRAHHRIYWKSKASQNGLLGNLFGGVHYVFWCFANHPRSGGPQRRHPPCSPGFVGPQQVFCIVLTYLKKKLLTSFASFIKHRLLLNQRNAFLTGTGILLWVVAYRLARLMEQLYTSRQIVKGLVVKEMKTN